MSIRNIVYCSIGLITNLGIQKKLSKAASNLYFLWRRRFFFGCSTWFMKVVSRCQINSSFHNQLFPAAPISHFSDADLFTETKLQLYPKQVLELVNRTRAEGMQSARTPSMDPLRASARRALPGTRSRVARVSSAKVFKMDQSRPLFCLFRSFPHDTIQI